MARLKISGGYRLNGEITVDGAKNAILPIMAAALLTRADCVIYGVPRFTDVLVMQQVLGALGAKTQFHGHTLWINASAARDLEVPPELMRRLRASNLVLGPLLARFHYCRIAYPGGCDIGSRPMDLHLKGLAGMGAGFVEEHGFIEATVAGRLRATEVHLDYPSVGATENLMMAAVLAPGQTVIRNAAKEPEIIDLQNFLNEMGARVRGAGLDVIRVEGVSRLHGTEHQLIPDRIEAGTHLIAGAITGGEVTVRHLIPEHLEALTAKLREAGMEITEYSDTLTLVGRGRPRATDIKTLPYPGFPTDLQPQVVSMLALAEGTSIVTENVFDNRFKHVAELRRMGAEIYVEGRAAIIRGVEALSGARVEASDLRAAAALVLAGLAAENTTILEDVEHLERGYAELDAKYRQLGAHIERWEDAKEVWSGSPGPGAAASQ